MQFDSGVLYKNCQIEGEFRDSLLSDICNLYVGVNECLSLFSTVFDEFWWHACL